MEIRLPGGSLRPWRRGDVDALARRANDREVSINLRDAFPHPYTKADARDWIARASRQDPPRHFAITVDGEAVGGIGFDPLSDVHRRTAEIGYWLGRDHWGRGLATDALRAAADYAFDTFDLVRLEAMVYAWNPASSRVLEKAGFDFEGRMRRRVTKEGRTIDALLYARVLDDR